MPYHAKTKRPKSSLIRLFLYFCVLSCILLELTALLLVILTSSPTPIPQTPHRTANIEHSVSVNLNQALAVSQAIDVSTKDKVQKATAPVLKPTADIPQAYLKIPRIGVDAIIRDMGITSGGAMAVPGNRTDVGWFSLGTRPGETGSAVIGGHNRFASEAAVFADLDKLTIGDILSVVDAKGVSISFIVRDMRTYDATDRHSGIFGSESGTHLNLVTCSGDWNPMIKEYTKRLVVFTDLIPTADTIAAAPTQTL